MSSSCPGASMSCVLLPLIKFLSVFFARDCFYNPGFVCKYNLNIILFYKVFHGFACFLRLDVI